MTRRFLLTALRHPEKADTCPSLTRRLLLKPRVFDLVSCLIQLRDLGAVGRIRASLRNVHELLIAWLHGCRRKNIEAIDLYSTNPKIRVMNMEAMTFADDTFDAVVMANTLSYSQDTFRCLSEVARVLKPSGRFAFGATYFPQSRDWPGNRVSGNDIRQMLKKLSLAVVFDKTNSLGGLQTAHIVGTQKIDPASLGFDRIDW
jgi:SAM-dependent methyltransferase